MAEQLGGATQSVLRVSMARSGKWASGIAFVGGLVADVLTPLAPFAAYIAAGAAVAALIIAIALAFRLLMLDRAMPALVFAATIAAISGGLYAIQQQDAAEDGLLASLVPAIAELQKSVGLVAVKVDEIDKKVTETQKTVDEVKQTTDEVAAGQKEQLAKTDKLQESTTDLGKKTDVIVDTQAKQLEEAAKQRAAAEELAKQNAAIAESQARQQAEAERQRLAAEELARQNAEIAANQAKQQAEAEKQRLEAEKQRAATEAVAKQTVTIAENQVKQTEQTGKLVESTEKLAASIETIADGFAALASQGGIIPDPKRPDEHYHNARVHELTGDMVNARRSYLAFANSDVDAVDPYIRFATLLRVQDGKAGAREVFGVLTEKNKTLSVKLVHALQFDDAQRIERLKNFIAANPDFAPAYFLYSEEFSEDRLGSQSLGDKRNEAEALTKFLSYEKDGGLLKFFIDHTLLADWTDRANRRLTALGNVLDPSLFAPKIIPQRSNQGWMVTISLSEPAQSIAWRLGTDGPFTETGFLGMNDQRTGKPMPNPTFALPDDAKAEMIGIKYVDISGREAGPFDIAFRPEAMLQEQNKQILDQFWTSWVEFDASGNRGNLYFTHLVSYRCAVREARYGFNGTDLTQELKMPKCDMENPYALPDGFMPLIKVKDDVKSMSLQLTYVDGTQSPVRIFNRK